VSTDLVTRIATAAVQLGVLALLVWLAKRGRYPVLAEPDPACAPTFGDRLRWHAADALAFAAGAVVAWVLATWPAPAVPQQLARVAAFDQPDARWLGAGFCGLAVAALLAYPLAARFVAAGPLQHFLWRSAALWRRLDPRPITRATARLVLFVALVGHFALREEHTTFTADGVVWRDWPWQGQQSVAWRDVTAVELVATLVAPNGNVRDVPHLRLRPRDGEPLVLGRWAQRPRADWERLGAIAADRSRVPLTDVPR
jgi:hypothetical protein